MKYKWNMDFFTKIGYKLKSDSEMIFERTSITIIFCIVYILYLFILHS